MNTKCETCKGHGRLTGACMGGLVDYECPECNGSGKQPTPTTDTQRLRELLAAATPGPWEQKNGGHVYNGPQHLPVCKVSMASDGAFIAALRNAAPALLEELDSLRKKATELKDERNTLHELVRGGSCETCNELRKTIADITLGWEVIFDTRKVNGMSHSEAAKALVAERDKLREEVRAYKAALDAMTTLRDEEKAKHARSEDLVSKLWAERDSLRRENEELKAKLR